MSDVLVVVTNWKRPENLPPLLDAIWAQTVACKVVVVDNSPADAPPLDLRGRKVDDCWRFTENAGPPCRFAPALLRHDCKYVLFLDDDLFPGPRAVERCLAVAGQLGGAFATIGEIGRRFKGGPDGIVPTPWRYVPKNIALDTQPRPVDMTCRAHFVRADLVWQAIRFKWALLERDRLLSQAVTIHDDLLLCLGIQLYTGYPSYLAPACDRESCLRAAELSARHAVSARPPHREERSLLINRAAALGWRPRWPLVEQSNARLHR